MLPSTSGQEEDTPFCYNNHRPKTLHRLSSSSSSSPPPFSLLNNKYIHQISNTPKPKTMEEVWKDINLASLNGHSSADQDLSLTPRLHNSPPPPPPPPRPCHHHSNSGFILQDFFTRPFRGDPSTRIISSTTVSSATTTSKNCGDHNNNTDLYGSLTPATILSLNSGAPGFDFLNNSEDLVRNSSHLQNHNSTSNVSSFITCFDGLDSSSGWASFGKRRAQDSDHSSSCDRRHKRMIKNRESAARSRARKQAYTHQLEAAVDQLNAENARLRREQEELCLAAAYQLRRKHTLHRTSTAPF